MTKETEQEVLKLNKERDKLKSIEQYLGVHANEELAIGVIGHTACMYMPDSMILSLESYIAEKLEYIENRIKEL